MATFIFGPLRKVWVKFIFISFLSTFHVVQYITFLFLYFVLYEVNQRKHEAIVLYDFPLTILTLLRVALVFKYQLLFKTVLHHDALS